MKRRKYNDVIYDYCCVCGRDLTHREDRTLCKSCAWAQANMEQNNAPSDQERAQPAGPPVAIR